MEAAALTEAVFAIDLDAVAVGDSNAPVVNRDLEHERQWEKYEELRQVLNEVRGVLIKCAELLAQVAGVPPLIVERNDQSYKH